MGKTDPLGRVRQQAAEILHRNPTETVDAKAVSDMASALTAVRKDSYDPGHVLGLIDASNEMKAASLDAGKKANALGQATLSTRARGLASTATAVASRAAFTAGIAGYLDAVALLRYHVGAQPMRNPRFQNGTHLGWRNDPFGDHAESFGPSAVYRGHAEGTAATRQAAQQNQQRVEQLQDEGYLVAIPPEHRATYGYEVATEAYQAGFNRAVAEETAEGKKRQAH